MTHAVIVTLENDWLMGLTLTPAWQHLKWLEEFNWSLLAEAMSNNLTWRGSSLKGVQEEYHEWKGYHGTIPQFGDSLPTPFYSPPSISAADNPLQTKPCVPTISIQNPVLWQTLIYLMHVLISFSGKDVQSWKAEKEISDVRWSFWKGSQESPSASVGPETHDGAEQGL